MWNDALVTIDTPPFTTHEDIVEPLRAYDLVSVRTEMLLGYEIVTTETIPDRLCKVTHVLYQMIT